MFGLFQKKLHNRLIVLSAIPYNRELFYKIAEKGDSDFLVSLTKNFKTKEIDELWSRYESTAQKTCETFDYIESKGGTVVRNFDLNDIQTIKEYDSVVIIAHHSDVSDEIEIQGKLLPTKKLVEAIPQGCKLFLDITSCYSAYLLPRIKVRIPESRIIGIDIKTSLNTRLEVLRNIVDLLIKDRKENYANAAIKAWEKCLQSAASDTETIYLGSKLQSTVYAPCEAIKGEDFIVSVFVHKSDESEEVEIRARSIDENAQKRNELKLKTKLKRGDVIDFQFTTNAKADFAIDERIKSIIWDNEIESIEFIVSVSADCQATQFVGKIKIAVNKAKVGDMIFKTNIREKKEVKGAVPCADFDFVRYDGEKAAREQGQKLLNKLNESRKRLQNINPKDSDTQRELDMCEKCLEILSHHSKEKHNRLEVFISSTSDMKPYRDIIREQVEACEMYPDMYEKWGQGNAYPRDMCCQHVLNADIFVCVLGANYGFVEKIWNKSMTEIEYRIAVKAGIPILIYILDDAEMQNTSNFPNSQRQEELINELKSSRLVGMFKSELNLRLLVNKELLVLKNNIR